jgi:hypothetical protein
MSALHPKADIRVTDRHVCYGPLAVVARIARSVRPSRQAEALMQIARQSLRSVFGGASGGAVR